MLIKKTSKILELAEEIISGKELKRKDNLNIFLNCNLNELLKGADKIRAFFSGEYVNCCSIVNAKSGKCLENCKFCAQSAHYNTNCEVFGFLNKEEILKDFLIKEKAGVDRFCLVTSGRALLEEDFKKALEIIKIIKQKSSVKLCVSMGFLTKLQLKALLKAGVSRFHCNLETSKNHFPKICTTHTYEMKVEFIKLLKEVGFSVCSGGIFGMGETILDVLDMAFSLKELEVDSIPINALIPIKNTPLENQKQLTKEEFLKIIAIFRYINPKAKIRVAAGRKILKNNGEIAFKSGACALIVGNMLTTKTDSSIKKDREMLIKMGRKVKIN